MTNELEQSVLSKAQKWLDGEYDEATKEQVRLMMNNNRNELIESFYKDLNSVRAACAASWVPVPTA